jgi:hypothetical protein
MGPNRFLQSFNVVRDWVENNLDVYKVSGSLQGNYAGEPPLTKYLGFPVRAAQDSVAIIRLFLPGFD